MIQDVRYRLYRLTHWRWYRREMREGRFDTMTPGILEPCGVFDRAGRRCELRPGHDHAHRSGVVHYV